MVQAATILQDRIDCLDCKATPGQIEELRRLVALLGFKLTPLKADKPKLSIWARRRIARAYKGISWDKVTGVTWYYRGPLCASNDPADIAAFYASKGEVA